MPEEIIPGLARISLPLPNNSLGSVNTYAVMSADGLRLIDCGWDAEEVYAALADELYHLGVQVNDIREILITHAHSDHIGLAERLKRVTDARLLLHRLDAVSRWTEPSERLRMVAETERWLQANGMPQEEWDVIIRVMRSRPIRIPTYRPDLLLEGGEVLDWRPFRFEVIWTPGHSAGLVCLYERQHQILLSSDHVLEGISPNIAYSAQHTGDPLDAYLHSLRLVRDLPVALVLPGHGAPFSDLTGRVDALEQHHEERLQAILDVVARQEGQNAYAIASQLPWRGSAGGWQQLQPFDRLAALSETLAHVQYLTNQGRVHRREEDGTVVVSVRRAER
jgi:glyoxylase-like metal-dependent hydrolase (beta-lactamase superfamily II)